MPRIKEEVVNKIIDTVDIVDVISDFVPLRKRGSDYKACCPFHNERTPSFSVSQTKGIFKCFGCGESGTAIGFVMKHESMSYYEALIYLARKYHIEVIEQENEDPEYQARKSRQESLYVVSDFAKQHFKNNLTTAEGQSIGYQYFLSRGLEKETIDQYDLGWSSSSHHALVDQAKQEGYKDEFLLDTGLCSLKNDNANGLVDRYVERAMFPIHNETGRVVAFGGRTLRSDYKEKGIGKYVNSKESEIYNKSRILYGLHIAKKYISADDECIMVEGYLDVLSMHQLGIKNVVASCGTSLTSQQVNLIKRYTKNVLIIYDGDSAGIHAAIKGIDLVLKEGMNVKILLLPDGDDPDSYSRKHSLDEFKAYIKENKQDFIEFKSMVLSQDAGNDPLKKAEVINQIADTIALIQDQVVRAMYIKAASEKYKIEESILYDRVTKTRKNNIAIEQKEKEREEKREEVQKEREGISTTSSTSITSIVNNKTLAFETEILQFLLLYGEDKLIFPRESKYFDEENTATVTDFIESSISESGYAFLNESHKSLYDEYMDLYYGQTALSLETIRKRLLCSEDATISVLVKKILEDQYQADDLNNPIFMNNNLTTQIPKCILGYYLERVKMDLEELQNDEERFESNMELFMQLTQKKNLLSREIGRV